MKYHKVVDFTTKDKTHIKLEASPEGMSLTLFQGDKQATVVLTKADRQQLARELYK